MNLKETVQKNPILAIMRNVPLEKTLDYAGAIYKGGVSFFEVALNSPDALKQIRMLREYFGEEVSVGAGTAATIELAEKAIEAGAQFLLSPATDEMVLGWCQERQIAMMPGSLTPSEVLTCKKYGYSVIKLFPAGMMPYGYVKSLKGPIEDAEYVAIGGVNAGNLDEFLRAGYLGVGLGNNILPGDILKTNDWAAGSSYVRTMLEKAQKAIKEREEASR